jgi:hypothetical protein
LEPKAGEYRSFGDLASPPGDCVDLRGVARKFGKVVHMHRKPVGIAPLNLGSLTKKTLERNLSAEQFGSGRSSADSDRSLRSLDGSKERTGSFDLTPRSKWRRGSAKRTIYFQKSNKLDNAGIDEKSYVHGCVKWIHKQLHRLRYWRDKHINTPGNQVVLLLLAGAVQIALASCCFYVLGARAGKKLVPNENAPLDYIWAGWLIMNDPGAMNLAEGTVGRIVAALFGLCGIIYFSFVCLLHIH